MIRRVVIASCAISLLVSSLIWGATGCTRGKKESPTPTLAVALATSTSAPAGPTRTSVPSPGTPSAVATPAGAPTTVVAYQPSPTPLLPTPEPAATPVSGEFEYTVQWGDTLYHLAQRFGTTVDAILALNGLQEASYIRVGQVLRIPGTSSATPPVTGGEYTVQAGDTLYSIARRYGTTIDAIQLANGITNPWYIRVGQKLIIPQAGTTPPTAGGTTYVVQPGDTLYGIAARFGRDVWDIVVANNLADPSLIYVGQVLTIP